MLLEPLAQSLCFRPLDHGGELRALGLVGRGCVDAVDVAVLVGTGEGLVAQGAFRSLLDPTRIRIGAEVHVRSVGGIAFGPVLRWVDMAAWPCGALDQGGIHNRGFGSLQLQPVIFELAADLAQKIIVDAAVHERIAEAAMGRLVGHRGMQAQPAKQHEIEPHLERPFQLRVRQPVPLADQKALEQHQRIVTLRPAPRPPQTARQDRRERPPVDQRAYLGKHVVIINPNRRFTQEKVHDPTRKLPHRTIAGQTRRGNPRCAEVFPYLDPSIFRGAVCGPRRYRDPERLRRRQCPADIRCPEQGLTFGCDHDFYRY